MNENSPRLGETWATAGSCNSPPYARDIDLSDPRFHPVCLSAFTPYTRRSLWVVSARMAAPATMVLALLVGGVSVRAEEVKVAPWWLSAPDQPMIRFECPAGRAGSLLARQHTAG